MNPMQFDKVVRPDEGDAERVYTLVAADDGLTMIHTGSVGGLLNRQANALADPVVLDETTRPFIDEIANNEDRAKHDDLEDLAVESPYSNFVPYSMIRVVQLDAEAVEPRLRLTTEQGVYHFSFTWHPGAQVRELAQLLAARANVTLGGLAHTQEQSAWDVDGS